MYDGVLWQFRLQDLIPTNHLLLMLLKDLQQSLVEVSLQRVIVWYCFLLHEGLDARIAVPLLTFIFIATDVHVGIWKQRRHLSEERIEKLVDLLARRV